MLVPEGAAEVSRLGGQAWDERQPDACSWGVLGQPSGSHDAACCSALHLAHVMQHAAAVAHLSPPAVSTSRERSPVNCSGTCLFPLCCTEGGPDRGTWVQLPGSVSAGIVKLSIKNDLRDGRSFVDAANT